MASFSVGAVNALVARSVQESLLPGETGSYMVYVHVYMYACFSLFIHMYIILQTCTRCGRKSGLD